VRNWLLDYLVCPVTGRPLVLADAPSADDVASGWLVSGGTGPRYPIVNGIPRFVSGEDYTSSFGYEWRRFPRLRLDSYNGTTLARETILRRTGWRDGDLRGRTVLECGCGAGTDTEVLLALGAERIIAFDYSRSVEQARENVPDPRVAFVQADVHRLPLRPGCADVVFCHRMIQHTPRPERAFFHLARHCAPGGQLVVHSYDRHLKSLLQWKYLLRPITRRLRPSTLMALLETVGPLLYHLQLPILRCLGDNRYVVFLSSRLNPFNCSWLAYRRAGSRLTEDELFDVSLLETYDALSPTHDHPSSAAAVTRWFLEAGFVDLTLTCRNPIVIKGRRPVSDDL